MTTLLLIVNVLKILIYHSRAYFQDLVRVGILHSLFDWHPLGRLPLLGSPALFLHIAFLLFVAYAVLIVEVLLEFSESRILV